MHTVIFDIDGTLLDSADVDDALYQQAVRSELGDVRFRPALSDYDYVSDSGILDQLLTDNGINNEPAVVDGIKARFVALIEAYIEDNGPFAEIPGARAFVAELLASDAHQVGVATGGWQATAQLKLQAAGFGDFHLPLASSDDARDRKQIMRVALQRLGSGSGGSVTYFGDGPWDRDAAGELGWNFVAVGPTLDGLLAYDPGSLASLLAAPDTG